MLSGSAADGDRRQDHVVEHHDGAEEQRREAACRGVAEVTRQQRGDPVVGFDPAARSPVKRWVKNSIGRRARAR